MKIKMQRIFLKPVYAGVVIVLINLIVWSCKRSDNPEEQQTGKAAIVVNMKGSVFADSKTVKKGAIGNAPLGQEQVREFSLGKDLFVEAVLSESSQEGAVALQAGTGSIKAATETSPLANAVRYKLLVYDNAGAYVTSRDYVRGEESNAATLQLQEGASYTFVAYSVNSESDLPAANEDNLSTAGLSIDGNSDFMYFSETRTVTAGTNYLNVLLKHLLSQISVTVDASLTGYNIMAISAGLDSHYPNAQISLADGSVTPSGTTETTAIVFPTLGSGGSPSVAAEPTVINGATNTGKMILNSITVGEIVYNVPSDVLTGLNITPGVKYNLKLTITPADIYLTHNNQSAARIRGLIWMRHNLGATISLNPDQNPSVKGLHGNYYQWGRRNAVANADTQPAAISGWNTTNAANRAWNSGTLTSPVKTANDPCPAGYRVPTRAEWTSLSNATSDRRIGNWTGSNTNYSAAFVLISKWNRNVILTFPVPGHRAAGNGSLQFRGEGTNYWTSTEGNTNSNAWATHSNEARLAQQARTFGFPMRCIAE